MYSGLGALTSDLVCFKESCVFVICRQDILYFLFCTSKNLTLKLLITNLIDLYKELMRWVNIDPVLQQVY